MGEGEKIRVGKTKVESKLINLISWFIKILPFSLLPKYLNLES